MPLLHHHIEKVTVHYAAVESIDRLANISIPSGLHTIALPEGVKPSLEALAVIAPGLSLEGLFGIRCSWFYG